MKLSLILLAAMAVIVALSFAPESEAAAVGKSTASRDVRVGAVMRKRASPARSAAAARR